MQAARVQRSEERGVRVLAPGECALGIEFGREPLGNPLEVVFLASLPGLLPPSQTKRTRRAAFPMSRHRIN
jgi:hypothetical protein